LADKVSVDSCGTAAFNLGKSPDPRSIAAAGRAGYDITQQIARQIDDHDYQHASYVVAMDRMNLTNVLAWAPADYDGEIKLLMDYCGHNGNSQIPDPYYDDEHSFDRVIFHCTAGKDRTGLAAALLLRILGVSTDDVMDDYLATNTFTRERIERIVHHINEMTMHQVNEDVVRVLFKVQSRFLNEAYKSIDEHYGNFASFVEIGLGFGEAECGRLRELLLEPAAGI